MPAAYKPGACHDGLRARRTPAVTLGVPPGRLGDGDLVAVGADLRPGTLLAAYRGGLFPMAVEGAVLGMAWWSPEDRGVLPLSGCGSPGRCAVRAPVRDPGGHRLRGGGRCLCRPATLRRVDRRRHLHGVHRAAPAGLGALGRGMARRGARRGSVRRCHRRSVRRGVDVLPRQGRLEGRADGPRRPAHRRVRRKARARHAVADPAPRDARCRGGAAAEYLRRLERALQLPLPDAFAQ